MRWKQFLARQNLKIVAILLVLALSVFGIVQIGVSYATNLVDGLGSKEGYATLENMTIQNVYSIQKILQNRIDYLRSLVGAVDRNLNNGDSEDMQELLQVQEALSIIVLGVIDQEGTCRTTAGEVFDLGEYGFVKLGFQGEEYLSSSWDDPNSDQIMNIFVVPLDENEGTSELLLVAYESQAVLEMFGFTSFQGGSGIRIIDKDGQPVIRSQAMKDEPLLATEFYRSEGINILQDYEDGNPGEFLYDYQGRTYAIAYRPLDFQGWTLVTYAPYEQIYGNIDILKETFSMVMDTVCGIILFLLLLFGILFLFMRNRFYRLRYYDGVTENENEHYLLDVVLPGKDWNAGEKAVVALDIDQFKLLNEIYGIQEGGRTLRYICRCFESIVPGERLYRSVADKFVTCLEISDRTQLKEIMDRFRFALKEAIEKKEIPYIKLSVGIAFCCEETRFLRSRIDALVAKKEIKGRYDEFYRFAEEEVKEKDIQQNYIESMFLEALRLEQFEVWYQPKYDGARETVVGAEALVRWRKPDGSLVPPNVFIPILEETGQIMMLDMEVLRQVCLFQAGQRYSGKVPQPVSVNLSRESARQPGIADRIGEMLETFDIQCRDLIFEITETGISEDGAVMRELIDTLHRMGFQVHMDDYGTGISGLKSLSQFAFDTVKLDKVFVDQIGTGKGDKILSSTIHLIESLDMNVIAEGVETQQQLKFLLEQGCRYIQGYYFSKPLSERDYENLLKKEDDKNA